MVQFQYCSLHTTGSYATYSSNIPMPQGTSILTSTHTSLKASVYTKKRQVTSRIFHDIHCTMRTLQKKSATINATYAWRVMGRLDVIPLNMQSLSCIVIGHIVNNYSLKWRWLAMDIYRAAKRRGKYPPLVTDTEVNSCLSIY